MNRGVPHDPIDSLPEPVRRYIRESPYAWSTGMVYVLMRRLTNEQIVRHMQILDENRVASVYREQGFSVHPTTGEPL